MIYLFHKKIGVFDLNHGAYYIAKKMKEKGYFVTIFDVYKKKNNDYYKNINLSLNINDIDTQD